MFLVLLGKGLDRWIQCLGWVMYWSWVGGLEGVVEVGDQVGGRTNLNRGVAEMSGGKGVHKRRKIFKFGFVIILIAAGKYRIKISGLEK